MPAFAGMTVRSDFAVGHAKSAAALDSGFAQERAPE